MFNITFNETIRISGLLCEHLTLFSMTVLTIRKHGVFSSSSLKF